MSDSLPVAVAEVLEHEAFVRGLARAALGADDQAEDVVQETLAAGVRRGGGPLRSVRAWLATVARRRSVDVLRRDATRRRHEESASRAATRTSPAPDEILAREEARRALVEELVALDLPSREVLVLRYYDDLAPRDIAARLGVPVETVRTRTKRALARLRDRLDARYRGERRRWAAPLAGAVGLVTAATVVSSSAGFVPWLVGGAAAAILGVGAFHFFADGETPPAAPIDVADAASADRPTLAGSGRALAAAPLERGTCRILGWVTRNGHPVAATVELRRAASGPEDATGVPLARTSTDARGGYAFTGLPLGHYALRATLASGTSATTFEQLEFEGQAGSANLRLAEGPHRLTGRVLDSDGAPAAARVVCTGPKQVNHSWAERPRVTTDAEGRFSFEALPAGEYEVTALPLGGEPNTGSEIAYVPTDGTLTVTLRPPFAPEPKRARGRVDGTVLDPDGRPVAGVRVRSQSSRELTHYRANGPTAISDPAGRFLLEGLGPGFVRLVVHDRGWTTPGLLDARDGADPLLFATDAEGRATAVVRVKRSGALSGTVRDGDGAPFVGAVVRAMQDRWGAHEELAEATSVSGPDGRFMIDTLVPDTDFEVVAWSPELASEPTARVRTPVEGDVQVDLAGLRLDPARWTQVEVRDEATSAPARDVWVSIHTADGASVARPTAVGSDGRVLLGPLPAGALEVTVEGPGLSGESKTPAAFPTTAVVLKRLPFARGRVRMPRGRDDAFVKLEVEAVDPAPTLPEEQREWEDRIGMDGTFVLTLRPGRWRVRATDDRHEPPLAAEAIVEAGDHDVVLKMEPRPAAPQPATKAEESRPRTAWRIRVLDPAGAPVEQATVAVWHVSPERWVWRSFVAEAEGETYEYWGDPTTAWFEVRDPKDALDRPLPLAPALAGPHDLSRGGGSIELNLAAEKHLRGVVRDTAGGAVRGAQITAHARWPEMVAVHPTALAKHGLVLTDAEGRFDFGGLADLEYELRLVVPRGLVPPEGGTVVRAGGTDVTLVVTRAVAPVVTVLDERGEPVTGVRVRAVPVGRTLKPIEEHEEDDDLPGIAFAATDERGRVVLRGLAPDRACVLKVGDRSWEGRIFEQQVDSWMPADTTVPVQRILQIQGRVLDTDGAPLAGAEVHAQNHTYGGHADADGRFRLSGFRPGRYRLLAQHGRMPAGDVVDAAAGSEDVVLRAPRGLDFEVRIEGWTPRWSDVDHTVVDASGKHLGGGSTEDPDANGILRWSGFPAGSRLSFRLRTRDSTWVATATNVPVGVPTTVPLEPGAQIRGRLVGPGGTVPANPGVSISGQEGLRTHPQLEPDGTFVIEGLKRGERVVLTGWGGPRDASGRATWITRLPDVEAGTTLDLEVRPP